MTKAPTVLYVEDDENDVLFMRLAFRRAGRERDLVTVADGRQAMRWLDSHPPPAVVLLDLNLPLVPGFEVLRWIRRQPSLERLPVVIFSSSGRQEDRQSAAELGADDYWLKPSSGLLFDRIVPSLQERWLATTR